MRDISIYDTKNVLAMFHKGGSSSPAKRFGQNWIKLWTRSKYCHVELYFPETRLSFSARGHDNEVGWKDIKYSHPERWDCVDLGIEGFDNLIRRCDSLCGSPYDYWGAVNKHWQKTGKWYCFEACNWVWGFDPCNVYGSATWANFKSIGEQVCLIP